MAWQGILRLWDSQTDRAGLGLRGFVLNYLEDLRPTMAGDDNSLVLHTWTSLLLEVLGVSVWPLHSNRLAWLIARSRFSGDWPAGAIGARIAHGLSVQSFPNTSAPSSWLQAGDLRQVIEVSIVAVHFGDSLTLHLSRDQGILHIYGVGGVEVKGTKVHLAVSQFEPRE